MILNPYSLKDVNFFVDRNWIQETEAFITSIDELPLVLVGGTGIGKTAVVHSLAEKYNMTIRSFILSQANDIGDFLGFSIKTPTNKIEFRFLKDWDEIFEKNIEFHEKLKKNPNYIPKQNEKCVIFLDEYNRASPDCVYAIFSLLSDYRIKGYQLYPQVTRIIGSINPVGDYKVSTDDLAFSSRVSYLPVETDTTAWFSWLEAQDKINKTKYAVEIKEFLEKRPDLISISTSIDYEGVPSPRSWTRLMNAIYHRKGVSEALAIGTIGKKAVEELKKFLEKKGKSKKVLPDENDIINLMKKIK